MESRSVLKYVVMKTIGARDPRVSRRGGTCWTDRPIGKARATVPVKPGQATPYRYSLVSACLAPLERVFLRASHAISNSRTLVVQLSHHCRLALDRRQRIVQRDRTKERVLERRTPVQGLVEWSERTQQVQIVVMRVQQQYRRVEDVISQEGTHQPASGGSVLQGEGRRDVVHHHWVHRVDMVLKRDIPKNDSAHQTSVATSNAALHRTRIATDRTVAQPRSTSVDWTPAELQRLTDHVLTTLDHRVIAMRERLGRV